MAYPDTVPTTPPAVTALLENNAINAGLTNASGFDQITFLTLVVATSRSGSSMPMPQNPPPDPFQPITEL